MNMLKSNKTCSRKTTALLFCVLTGGLIIAFYLYKIIDSRNKREIYVQNESALDNNSCLPHNLLIKYVSTRIFTVQLGDCNDCLDPWFPKSFDIDHNDNIYILDSRAGKILMYNKQGSLEKIIFLEFANELMRDKPLLYDLTVGPHNSFYLWNAEFSFIEVYNENGQIIKRYVLPAFARKPRDEKKRSLYDELVKNNQSIKIDMPDTTSIRIKEVPSFQLVANANTGEIWLESMLANYRDKKNVIVYWQLGTPPLFKGIYSRNGIIDIKNMKRIAINGDVGNQFYLSEDIGGSNISTRKKLQSCVNLNGKNDILSYDIISAVDPRGHLFIRAWRGDGVTALTAEINDKGNIVALLPFSMDFHLISTAKFTGRSGIYEMVNNDKNIELINWRVQ